MAVLPKSNNNSLPINQRKKAVPGVKPSVPPAPVIEQKPLPKEEPKVIIKEEPIYVPPKKVVPKKTAPPAPAPKILEQEQLPKEDAGILEFINRRQQQLILHSVLYYRMNTNLVTDSTWDMWARELVRLHKAYPKLAEKSIFWQDMKDFDATTGFHLADHVWGVNKALWILDVLKEAKRKGGKVRI